MGPKGNGHVTESVPLVNRTKCGNRLHALLKFGEPLTKLSGSKNSRAFCGSNPTHKRRRLSTATAGRCTAQGEEFGVLAQHCKQRKSCFVPKAVAVLCASSLLAGCIGFGFASAGGAPIDYELFDSRDSALSVLPEGEDDEIDAEEVSDTSSSEKLKQSATRDISQGIEAIEAEEEAARKAAEEAARAEEQKHIDAAEEAEAAFKAQAAAEEDVADAIASLGDVDWSVGEDEFIAEWTVRIDNYLAGSPLAGHGKDFAEAAWEYGVDPRWSPAIANTESTKGRYCFESYNAWGWTDSITWDSWSEAIDAHVQGLSESYGYSITLKSAKKYCPPNYENWFNKTLAQMKTI